MHSMEKIMKETTKTFIDGLCVGSMGMWLIMKAIMVYGVGA
jgi:hypothetical protein